MEMPITSPLVSSNATQFTEPIMHFFSSALLLGAYAFQTVLGRPGAGNVLKRSVDDFIDTQTPISLERLLCNIGSDGCAADGAASGVVVASPDRVDPPCKCPT